MDKIIVAISIEKIQKYIYGVLDDRDLITQKDSGTLSSIVKASHTVSDQINQSLDKMEWLKFAERILDISGKRIFVSTQDKVGILKDLDEMFRDIYKQYRGKIFLNYTVFPYDEAWDEIVIIKEATRRLKESQSKTNIILRNSDVLFGFYEVGKLTKDHKEFQSYQVPDDLKRVFVADMDSLVDYKHIEDGTNGKIAIVKADINNLGQFFASCISYEEYIKISDLLKDKISLAYFAQKLEKEGLVTKIFPIYVAGDDIFYAVKIDSVIQSVVALRNIIDDINREIAELAPNQTGTFSIAVGCVFVNNHQPIRYYREAVEEQLSIIKNEMKDTRELKKAILGFRVLENHFFLYANGYQGDNNLAAFSKEMLDLDFLRRKGVLTNSFVYGLINYIENGTCNSEKEEMQKVMYSVLYRLRPTTGLSERMLYDMILKHYFLNMLVEKRDINRNEKKQGKGKMPHKERKFLECNLKNKLLPKLQLIVMLLDEKYGSKSVDEGNDQYKGSLFRVEDIKSSLFNRPLNYLVELATKRESELIKLFIGKEKATDKVTGKDITVYKKINIDKGCLFKCKKLIEMGKKELVFDVIQNSISIKESINTDIATEQKKSHYTKDFLQDRNKFYVLIDAEKEDWIDVVIIYYEYLEQRKQYLMNKDYAGELKKYNNAYLEGHKGKFVKNNSRNSQIKRRRHYKK